MLIVSTGLNPPVDAHRKCIESVQAQTEPHKHKIFLGGPHDNNIREAVRGVDPEEIVVFLDADDWLAHPLVLERVREAHGAGAWVTYGSYVFADGRPATWQKPTEWPPRGAPWAASHLKTARAGLVQRLRLNELALKHGRDQALMFPLLEMAGPDRSVFLSEVLYVYNWGNSFEFSADAAGLAEEQKCIQLIRSREPYERIEKL